MKIRTLIAQCTVLGAIAAGSLALSPGTAQAAVNCDEYSLQMGRALGDYDMYLDLSVIYSYQGDYANADFWEEEAVMDYSTYLHYRSLFRAAHCA